MSEAEKAIKEAEMEQLFARITSQALEHFNNKSKGDESKKEAIRQELLKLMERETSRMRQYNLERLKIEKERATAIAVSVESS